MPHSRSGDAANFAHGRTYRHQRRVLAFALKLFVWSYMADPSKRGAQQIAFKVGMSETRLTLREWFDGRGKVALPWLALSLLIACSMFLGTYAVATKMPQAAKSQMPMFIFSGNSAADALDLLLRNSMVLLLHLLVCVAAYLARRAVPMQAKYTSGVNRWVHENAGGVAMLAVAGMTVYSLAWQTWQLGNALHSASDTLDISAASLLVRASLHGIPELTAMFLPLAACLILGWRKQWNQMLAASVLCACISLPILVAAAATETWATRLLF